MYDFEKERNSCFISFANPTAARLIRKANKMAIIKNFERDL